MITTINTLPQDLTNKNEKKKKKAQVKCTTQYSLCIFFHFIIIRILTIIMTLDQLKKKSQNWTLNSSSSFEKHMRISIVTIKTQNFTRLDTLRKNWRFNPIFQYLIISFPEHTFLVEFTDISGIWNYVPTMCISWFFKFSHDEEYRYCKFL